MYVWLLDFYSVLIYQKTAILNQVQGLFQHPVSCQSLLPTETPILRSKVKKLELQYAHKAKVEHYSVLTGCVLKAADAFLNLPNTSLPMITLFLLFDHMMRVG